MLHDSIPCISILTTDQMQDWMDGNLAGRGDGHFRRLAGFWQDVENGERVIWCAWSDHDGGRKLLGQVTVQHQSHYPSFRRRGVFELVDLWVRPDCRQHGFGRLLLRAAVDYARQQNCIALGLGVGVTRDFGPAQKLYAQEGFIPDGSGLWVEGARATEGDVVTMGDGVILMLEKNLASVVAVPSDKSKHKGS